MSQTDILVGLGKVVYPEYIPPKNKGTAKTNASAYKSCADDGGNLAFLFPDRLSAFDDLVGNNYPAALKAMCGFTEQFIETDKSLKRSEWLVKALLELIENDANIADTQVFYICSNGQGITKAAIRHMSDFALQPFLLGVWHFVVVNKPDNKSGKETFDRWCPPQGRNERKYEGVMGEGINREINVEVLPAPPDDGESAIVAESELAETTTPTVDADPKRITVNNYGTVQDQKFISIETMNGDINL